MPSVIRRIWKWSAATLAAVLILLGIGVGIFRLMVEMAPDWRADMESMAEQALGWPVQIGEIDLRWALLGPELLLENVQVLSPETREPIAVAERIDVAFGPKDLLQGQALRPGRVRLHRPSFALERDAEGTLYLSGYALPMAQGGRVEWREILDATLRHGRLTVLDGEMHYRDHGRGIAEWVLLLPRVSVASDGRVHELEGSVVPPGALGEHLEFRFSAEGPAAAPEDWQWSLNLGARDLHLQWWYQQFQWAGSGKLTGTVDLAADLQGRGMESWSGQGVLRVLELGLLPAQPVIGEGGAYYEHIAFDWQIEKGDATQLQFNDIEMRHEDRRFQHGTFRMQHDPSNAAFPLRLLANRVPLEEIHRLARFLPVDDKVGAAIRQARERILQFEPRGMLRDMELALDPRARPLRFRIEGEFDSLGFAQWQQMPGFAGLSGSIKGDDEQGRLRVDSRNVAVDMGDLFRTALPARRLAGNLEWSRDDRGWRIRGENLEIENPEAQATADLDLLVPHEGPVLIDLVATARNADFHARSTWLPVGIMSDALIDWLDNAVIEGRAPEAQLVLRGPLKNFPYRDGSGIFDIRFLAENVAVEYAPDWPKLENLSAHVRFFGPSLDIHVHDATIMNALKVVRGEAHFADLQDGNLQLRADVEGDVEDGWRFLEASPLAETLSGVLNSMQVAGPMNTSLEMQLPLANAQDLDLLLETELRGANVQLSALPWPVSDLAGRLRITRHEVSAEGLEGRLHGFPLHVALAPEAEGSTDDFAATRITLAGRSGVKEFSDYVPPTWLARLEGDFGWKGDVLVPADGSGITMQLSSTMSGVETELPAPLNIPQAVEAELLLSDAERIDAHVRLPELGALRIRFVEGPGGWDFDRGRVELGATEAAPLPSEAGLRLEGRTSTLDVGGWLALDDSADAEEAAVPLLREFDLFAERMSIAGMAFGEQALRGSRKAGGWELVLAGPAAEGTIVVPASRPDSPPGGRPLHATFSRLHLPIPDPDEDDGDPVDPRSLPGVELGIEDFRLGTVQLGRVTGRLERTSIGYSTTGLRARSPSFDLSVSGRWEFVAGQHYTSLTGALESANLEDTLRRLGYDGGIAARVARASASLAWPGSPMSPNREGLEGSLGFEIRDGSLREVNPGAGRLLGLLSITALPRRLFLDFTDFLGEGLHFDSIKGDFVITQGNAYTTNTRLRGPSLSALLVGRTGIADQDYDQLAIVNPGVSASLPVAGYLAAGPQVGAALLLLSQLLKAPLADITQVKYRITGSWDEPVIERVVQERNGQTKD